MTMRQVKSHKDKQMSDEEEDDIGAVPSGEYPFHKCLNQMYCTVQGIQFLS